MESTAKVIANTPTKLKSSSTFTILQVLKLKSFVESVIGLIYRLERLIGGRV